MAYEGLTCGDAAAKNALRPTAHTSTHGPFTLDGHLAARASSLRPHVPIAVKHGRERESIAVRVAGHRATRHFRKTPWGLRRNTRPKRNSCGATRRNTPNFTADGRTDSVRSLDDLLPH